nr:bacillithiol biosynthesis BshC [Asgard group archaeon]
MAEEIELELLDLKIMYPNEMLLDYLQAKNPMHDFFKYKPEDLHSVKYTGDRGILKEVLMKYNKSINAHDNTLANIELVENKNTKFVITGQQPGLFTGPLYTIYKTFSAINYAKLYSTNDLHLIPMFWNASEDHDIAEVNNIWILNKDNDVIPVKVESDDHFGKSIERIELDKPKIRSIVSFLLDNLPETEFSDELFNKLLIGELEKSTYWGEYFSRILSKLMQQWGLIIIEPYMLRPYLVDYYAKILSNPTKYNNIFLNTTEQLNQIGYKPKMHKKEEIVGLFYIDSENNRNNITINNENLY